MLRATAKTNSENMIVSTNPSRGYEILGEVEISTQEEIQDKVTKAHAAQKKWHAMGLDKRIELLHSLLKKIENNKEAIAEKTSQDMGQAINLSSGMVEAAISNFKWNLENAPRILAPVITYEDDVEVNQVVYEPIGVGACIMAWNFPLPNFMWAVLQALIAGNAMVIKYSEEIPLFQKFFEDMIHESDLPEGVVSFVYGDGAVGSVLTDQDIDFISFTGSFQTGHALYKKAAEKFIPVTLELGGSSPGIVFEDADLEEAAEKIFGQRFSNCGQFCSDLKRLIVHHSIFDDLTERLVEIAKSKKLGDPLSRETDLGPLVAERQVIRLEDQVQDALNKGATLHCGGKRPEGLDGAFYEPTILTNISKDMKVWREEVFGPVLPIVSFETYDEAIELANDTAYGLTGFIYTKDQDLAKKALHALEAGAVSANRAYVYRAENPFGGYKHSGLGRENGVHGFHEVCQVKVMGWEK